MLKLQYQKELPYIHIVKDEEVLGYISSMNGYLSVSPALREMLLEANIFNIYDWVLTQNLYGDDRDYFYTSDIRRTFDAITYIGRLAKVLQLDLHIEEDVSSLLNRLTSKGVNAFQ